MERALHQSDPISTLGRVTSTSLQSGMLDKLFAMNPGLVGASTGYLTALRGRWHELVEAAGQVSCDVVELSALSANELPGLAAFLHREAVDFRRVMVHAPAKNADGWSDAMVSLLKGLPQAIEGFVVHPETVANPKILVSLGSRVLLENMDWRKRDARDADEMQRYFQILPDARFCFDIAHAKLNDPTFSLAHSLLDRFGDRLAEVHISSIQQDGHHVPLTESDLTAYEPILALCVGVPWILEASVAAHWSQ